MTVKENRFTFDKKPELSQALWKMCTNRFGADRRGGNRGYWSWLRWGSNRKGLSEINDFPKVLESEEFLPMMFASEETPLSRMIFSKVDAVLEALREDQTLREIALLEKE